MMSNVKIIMVAMDEHKWTLDALYEASRLSQKFSGQIVIVAMIPTSHLSWLGTELGFGRFSPSQANAIATYQQMLQEDKISFSSLLMQYVTFVDAIVQAAEHVHADFVFARIPKTHIPFWANLQKWFLSWQLAKAGCKFFSTPDDVSIMNEGYPTILPNNSEA